MPDLFFLYERLLYLATGDGQGNNKSPSVANNYFFVHAVKFFVAHVILSFIY